jgi:hypothetical protein
MELHTRVGLAVLLLALAALSISEIMKRDEAARVGHVALGTEGGKQQLNRLRFECGNGNEASCQAWTKLMRR